MEEGNTSNKSSTGNKSSFITFSTFATFSTSGFTLVELLVVMAIIGILAALGGGAYFTSQMRGRDAERKSDLKNIVSSLELYLSDYGSYPADAGGQILGCPYDPVGKTGTACAWGQSAFTDGKTTYFKVLPKDPATGYTYFYRTVANSGNSKFQLFARLENPQDKDCLGGNCASSPVAYSCGTKTCNFAITSANTTPTE